MRRPRTEGFDPRARGRKAATLHSPLDNLPTIEPPASDASRPLAAHAGKELPAEPPAQRTVRRRHKFDIYDDQYKALRQLALADVTRGRDSSMSAMVREAIDHYLYGPPGKAK